MENNRLKHIIKNEVIDIAEHAAAKLKHILNFLSRIFQSKAIRGGIVKHDISKS